MSVPRIFVVGLGVITAAGRGVDALCAALHANARPLRPLSRLAAAEDLRLPAGEAPDTDAAEELPRTHVLALVAAREALAGRDAPPDAVVLGVTTGGIARTEVLLAAGETAPPRYRRHGAGTVAEVVAREVRCSGPALTVATACSSGAVALHAALELLRSGRARLVLAGGADGLSLLTYHGFRLLQLIDPRGARPFDRDRAGMTVGEAAGMLLLAAADVPPAGALAELRGGGLSCDAFHPTRPLPGGEGARRAIERALDDAGLAPRDVDYVNLHGTGTIDNDAAEAAAVRAVWPVLPALSSTKGLTGHTLAAAGAVEAAISVLAMRDGFVPGNVGLHAPDASLGLRPLPAAADIAPRVVVSNSFGFGGANAALVFAAPEPGRRAGPPRAEARGSESGSARAGGSSMELEVLGASCISGAGDLAATLECATRGASCAGLFDDARLAADLPARTVRRLRRLPRLALALATAARRDAGDAPAPRSVFFGTAWGPLSETHAFLAGLSASGDRFAGPAEFVGSVHNAPAGQAAMLWGAQGPNVTASGGVASFEQALLLATLLVRDDDQPVLIGAADEFHSVLSPLLDPLAGGAAPADGGGALIVRRAAGGGPRLRPLFLGAPSERPDLPSGFVEALGGAAAVRDRCAAVFVAQPRAERATAERQLAVLRERTGLAGPAVDLPRLLGGYATVSAAGAALAAHAVRDGTLPAALAGGTAIELRGRGILLLALGRHVAAVEVRPSPGGAP